MAGEPVVTQHGSPAFDTGPQQERPENVIPAATITTNLKQIQGRIAEAAARAGRCPGEVRLVAVTKAVGLDEMRTLYDLGLRHFGENRVDIARAKRDALGAEDVRWHMIGNVQRRKTRDVLEVFDFIDAVDRLELAESIQTRCQEAGRRATVLVEVNVSGEAQKHGVAPGALEALLDDVARLDRVMVRGLMTMAPYGAPEHQLRGIFTELAELAHRAGLPEVSMGMSEDYEVAIECGATEVRVGSALFE